MTWTNTTKDWDYNKPIHRINSPFYQTGSAPDGNGAARTRRFSRCRRPAEGPDDSLYGLLIRDVIQAIPGWVPVIDQDNNEREVEGILDRCFQTWTDVPVLQWHQWYDWNFHIEPDPAYAQMRGLGNTAHARREIAGTGTKRRVETRHSMECEWDCGAFGPKPGSMFRRDWAWPMTGQYAWFSGRWIYDCGHATDAGLMRTELHPCKAVATARWEAFRFDENGDYYVPAIQFMFFASRKGGYFDFPAINDRDYEFIVDLPRVAGGPTSAAIGHTIEYPLNTVVLRERQLLRKIDHTPFNSAFGNFQTVAPIIEPIAPSDPDGLPEQVRIRVPLTQLPASTDAYGVIVSLGWHDPDGSQARRVKRCRVVFHNVHKGSYDHDTFAEEWSIKVGVNGRWFTLLFEGVRNNRDLELGNWFYDIWLSEDDALYISSHGAEIDLVGGFFERAPPNRTLRHDGSVVDWERDIVRGRPDFIRDLCYDFANLMARTFNDQNDPIGIIDPVHSGAAHNPLRMAGRADGSEQFSLRALFTEELGASAELAEDTRRTDYLLNYTVAVTTQSVP